MSAKDDLVAVYLRQLPRVRTINGLNRLHIALENRMSPREAWRIAELDAEACPLPTQLGEKALIWRATLREQMLQPGKAEMEPFVRERLARDIARFGMGGGRDALALVVIFTGAGQRPMMPTPLFAQHFDATRNDLVVLRDPNRKRFREGLFGAGNDLRELVETLRTLAATGSYERLYTIGTSSGGLPALIAGLALGAQAAVSVGGAAYDGTDHSSYGHLPLPQALEKLRSGPGRNTRIVHAFSPDVPSDMRHADTNRALLGGNRVVIRSVEDKVSHIALYPLVRDQRLSLFLDQALRQE